MSLVPVLLGLSSVPGGVGHSDVVRLSKCMNLLTYFAVSVPRPHTPAAGDLVDTHMAKMRG
jgi:hypothetical protein